MSKLINAIIFFMLFIPSFAFSSGPGPDGNKGHLNRLLHNSNVISYLSLSEEQATTAQAISNEIIESRRIDFEIAMSIEERSDRAHNISFIFIDTDKLTFEKLSEVLSKEQYSRLKQIDVQTFGVRSFRRPDVIDYLMLTDDQKTSILDIANQAGRQLAEISRSQQLSTDEKSIMLNSVRLNALESAKLILDQYQIIKWDLLTGSYFSI